MMTQNVHSLRSKNQAINFEEIIDIMISKKFRCILYSRNMVGRKFYKRDINSYIMFHHGLISQKYSRRQKGVAIILSPKFIKAYHDSGSVPPTISANEKNESFRRFIGLIFSISVKR